MAQVDKSHYDLRKYDDFYRWMTYWYQIQAVVRSQPRRVLEIGPGTGLLSHYLRERIGLDVTTFDIADDLKPDVVGDLRQLSTLFEPQQFDIVCAFQVLEHLPFDQFGLCLQQMATVSRGAVVLSLPHYGRFVQMRLRWWRSSWDRAWGFKLTPPHDWQFDGQHYWEIGTRQTPLRRVRAAIEEVLTVERAYFCPDNPYHYFFECRVRR